MHSRIFDYIDPVIFTIFGVSIRWYGVAYVLGILLGYTMFKYNATKICALNLNAKFYDDLIFYVLAGIVIGGRLGEVIFYDSAYYFSHPIEILKIYKGGMSFHGGLIGSIISVYLVSRKHKLDFLHITDIACTVSPIGLFLGRLANFINAELIGKPTDVPWGIIFPNSDGLPRHPSQLYEAFFEGIILFLILNLVLRFQYRSIKKKTNKTHKNGKISALFLILYSTFIFFIEYFKEPYLTANGAKIGIFKDSLNNITAISRGQSLSILMLFAGFMILFYTRYHNTFTDASKNLEKKNGHNA